MNPHELAKRNTEIVAMRKQGHKLQYIATIYEVSRERVRQICLNFLPEDIEQIEGQAIEWLRLSDRVLNALHRNEIHTIPTLQSIKNYERLSGIRGVGAKEIVKALKKHKESGNTSGLA